MFSKMFRTVLISTLVALACAVPQESRQAFRLDGRIVGGQDTTIEQFPHQISLLYYGSHRCGGSIINEKYILTAAHCTDGITAENLQIRAGSSIKNSGGVVEGVARIYQHPEFSGWTLDNDITVLELIGDLQYTPQIQPIRLVDSDDEPQNDDLAICTGWGALSAGGPSPSQLQEVTVPIVNRSKCKELYSGYTITENMICAGLIEGGKDACQGDSGGPLVTNGNLVGVVSWGVGCASPNYPGIYSNVAQLRSFVSQITGL